MSLPILKTGTEASPEDLLRLYWRTELHWTRHLAEETTLDVGAALVSAALPRLPQANRMLDAVLPEDVTPEQALAMVENHFAASGSRCASWMLNAAAPAQRRDALAEYLLSHGYQKVVEDLYCLAGMPRTPIKEAGGLKIIPARASFRHARQLAEERGNPSWVEAALLHLDDSHTDSLLALLEGRAAAGVSVLAVGELGAIHDLYVAKDLRRRGLGQTMMSRALEICARSLFKHVFACLPADAPAAGLFQAVGFRKIADAVTYQAALCRAG